MSLQRASRDYDVRYGSFYDTTGLVRWLGVSRQALADRVRRGALLACRTADGHLVYPASQFTGSGTLRPGLAGVLREFSGVDGWAVLAWLTTPSAAFDGMCATDLLVLGGDPERVRTAAAGDAARWAA